jgi:class 3 adenylate cyclase
MPKRRSKKRNKLKVDEESDAAKTKAERTAFLERVLGFKHFLSSGFEPVISDAEIVVCFADVRGFTEYCRKLQQEMQDRKIQNFLRDYFKIFNEGLLDLLTSDLQPEILTRIERHAVPIMYKNLGDGLMMVWEIPFELDNRHQGNLTQLIVWIVQAIEERFYYRFRNLTPVELDSYSQEVTNLDIGFGMAKGHAWRLDFGRNLDYAGSIINLASRLASFARPRGIIADCDVSTWLFDEMVQAGMGKIVTLKNIKGYEPGTKVWCDKNVKITGETA